MDKVFQIHLAGMVFTIEEKAYEKIKSYNESIRRHFADNTEVVQDIEARMAELFSQRLGSNRTTLFMEDIDQVIQTLGHLNQMDIKEEPTKNENGSNTQYAYQSAYQKRFRRDPYDQSLGGVCAGLASFFNVDPVLIRVLFVLLLVAFGGGILLYLILWIAVPQASGEEAFQMRLQREQKSKKLFRDNDARVVGGVASGLANYFGLDVVWIRVAFLIGILVFGTGFWLYIILWIIVPKAITASEKLMMKGRNVDIHTIQQQVLESKDVNKMNSISQHGSHLVGIVLKGMLKLIGSFAAIILFFIVVGVSIAMLAVFFNLGNTNQINELIQFTIKDNSIILAAKAGIFLVLLTPFLALLMFVIKVLFNLSYGSRAWFFSLTGLFAIGVACLLYSGISFASTLNQSESKSTISSIVRADTLYLKGIEMPFEEEESDDERGEIVFKDKGIYLGKSLIHLEIDDLKIRGGKGDSAYLKIIYRSNGKNRVDAEEKIEMIQYKVAIRKNEISIPNYFSLAKTAQFSWQEVDLVLVVPNGTVINIDEICKENLNEESLDEADGQYYKVNGSELHCTDCEWQEEPAVTEEESKLDSMPNA